MDLLEKIKETFPCPNVDVRTYSPLALAFIGDGIYEVVVRTMIVAQANRSNTDLHKATVKYVKAENQSKMVEILKPHLTQEECDVLRRGRNAKPHTVAKNASLGEYHRATGLEALFGYLYLAGQTDRMLELMKIGIEGLEQA
ncbi:MAG: ribonuclease III [Lachnospiraceae bacterium]|nr:ribonuclease III [Lachnospiraceae bacterium]MBP5280996.1 ribonuclease III [Lachnospiraceae bacterium]